MLNSRHGVILWNKYNFKSILSQKILLHCFDAEKVSGFRETRLAISPKYRIPCGNEFFVSLFGKCTCLLDARKLTFDVKAVPFSSYFGFSFKIDYEENIKYNNIQFCFSYSYDVSKTKVTC